MSTEFHLGGGWGDAIEWVGERDQFQKPFGPQDEFRVTGWKTPKPQVGDTLKAEFERSWFYFRFIAVEPCGDPPDMFFATVQPFKRIMKETGMEEPP